jgi:uncharacterized iron-regulated protein
MAAWAEQVEQKAAILLDQMAAACVLAEQMDIDAADVMRPYLDMLNTLYEDELPNARALDRAPLG